MRKPKFKVGDKIKVTYNRTNSLIVEKAMGKVGIVCIISHMIYVKFDKEVWQNLTEIGFFEDEIERVSRVGQQLLFEFMNEVT